MGEVIIRIMQKYDVRATSKAPAAVVWRLLLDARSWPDWSTIDSLDLERSSGLGPDGRDTVGTVRAFRTGRTVTGERLTSIDEEKRLTYEDAFHPAISDYRAVVELTATPEGGTHIHWHGTFSTHWATGWLVGRTMRGVMQRMANRLASHAATITNP